MGTVKIKFSARVIKGLDKKINKSITQAVTGSPEMKKEMNKIFQQANRRAQNVEKAGLPSPALKAAYRAGRPQGTFTKWSIAGLDIKNENDWKKALDEYGSAMAYLNQPTSQASGAREYIKHVADENNLPEDVARGVVDAATSPQVDDNGVPIMDVMKYGTLIDDAAADVSQAADELDADSETYADDLQAQVKEAVQRVTDETMSIIDEFNNNFGNGSPRMK